MTFRRSLRHNLLAYPDSNSFRIPACRAKLLQLGGTRRGNHAPGLECETMAQNPPRKHHYIPIFYTKAWASRSDGLVCRFTKPHETTVDRRVNPAAVGWAKDLYALPGDNSEDRQFLEERFFSQLDNVAAVALAKMNSTPMVALTKKEVTAWSLFMRSLLSRTPDTLQAMKESGVRVWENGLTKLRDHYPDLRSSSDPESFDEYLARRDPQDTERGVLRVLPRLLTNPKIEGFVSSMHWQAIDIPAHQPELLLSDNPVLRTNGLRVPGGHWAMPLSPRRLMVATWERELAANIGKEPIREVVRAMNKWTVESARHFVVSTSTAQMGYIARHFGTNPKVPLHSRPGQI
jgi:hypothetical protein